MKKALALILAMCLAAFASSTSSASSAQQTIQRIDGEVYGLAYMSLEESPKYLQDDIVAARNEIIAATDGWVADGFTGEVIDFETGEVQEVLPSFHDIFPEDWELPVGEWEGTRQSDTNIQPCSTGQYSASVETWIPKAINGVKATAIYWFRLDSNHLGGTVAATKTGAAKTHNLSLCDRYSGAAYAQALRLSPSQGLHVNILDVGKGTTDIDVRVSTFDTPSWGTVQVLVPYLPSTSVR